MKLLLVCWCALFTVALANVLEFKNTAEDGDITRFEVENDAYEEEMEKRMPILPPKPILPLRQRCQSGYVQSKYCKQSARRCFGRGQFAPVNFKPPFRTTPQVTLGLTLIDAYRKHNVRVRVSPERISKTGFSVKFSPWDKSLTYQLGVHWMACP